MIESPRNPRIVEAARLHRGRYRREVNKTILEGPNVVSSALGAGVVPEVVFTSRLDAVALDAAAVGVEVVEVTEAVLRKLSGTDHPRGPVAVVAIPSSPTLQKRDTVVLCRVRDPGNAGTLIRSAAAFGFQVAATSDTVDMWGPKVLRAAAGTHFATNLVGGIRLHEIAKAGIVLVALVAQADDAADPKEGDRPIGLMVGNEAHGLSANTLRSAQATLTVPMHGDVESLNAAVAGSIAMFAIAQGRPGQGGSEQ